MFTRMYCVSSNNECKEYFGTVEGEFKLRYNNHTIYSGASKRMHLCINVGQENVTCI